MAIVDLTINGRIFAVACDEGQEARISELARELDERVRRLGGGQSAGSAADAHLMVLVALTLADELDETKTALGAALAGAGSDGGLTTTGIEGLSRPELLVEAVDHLARRVAGIADRLGRA